MYFLGETGKKMRQWSCSLCLRATGTDQVLPRDEWWMSGNLKGKANMGDTFIGVYYRPSDQDEETDEVLSRQLKVGGISSHKGLQTPWLFTGKSTLQSTHSPRGSCSAKNITFDTGSGKANKERCAADLVHINEDGLAGDVKAGDNCGWTDHEIVKSRILHGREMGSK